MPEATVNEYNFFPRAEYKVWLAGEILPVQSVPVAHSVHQTPDYHLRLGVPTPDLCHVGAAALGS